MDDLEDDAELTARLAWLAQAGPDDWHRVALDYNWSEDLAVLEWIVRQDECDVATALTIFWRGEPAFFIGNARDCDNQNARICAYVAERVRAGGYTRSRIAFDPDAWWKDNYVELVGEEAKLADPLFRTSPGLIQRRFGRHVVNDGDFYRRYPAHLRCSHDVELPPPTPQGAATMQIVRNVEARIRERLPSWLR